MNAMPSSPPPDPGYWFNVADHLEAIIAGIGTAVITAGAALWRIAAWTAGMRGELEQMRHETGEWREAMLEKLDFMQNAQKERHEATKREMDQIHIGVRDDKEETRAGRQETREAIAALSRRIDDVIARDIIGRKT